MMNCMGMEVNQAVLEKLMRVLSRMTIPLIIIYSQAVRFKPENLQMFQTMTDQDHITKEKLFHISQKP